MLSRTGTRVSGFLSSRMAASTSAEDVVLRYGASPMHSSRRQSAVTSGECPSSSKSRIGPSTQPVQPAGGRDREDVTSPPGVPPYHRPRSQAVENAVRYAFIGMSHKPESLFECTLLSTTRAEP